MKNLRTYSLLDHFILKTHASVSAIFHAPYPTRPNPAAEIAEGSLTKSERTEIARLMRINHSGEICAQALYQGQAFTMRSQTIAAEFKKAAYEEQDHLAWCAQRIDQLEGHTSYLNPLWYFGSLTLGAFSGFFGDGWNLGFLKETEIQVSAHLAKHMTQIPKEDKKTHAILQQMHHDEATHAVMAKNSGAYELPSFYKMLMRFTSKIMTKITYWI